MVNYNFQTPNIGQQFMGGYSMGQEIMAKRAAQQRQAEMQEEMGNFATQPNKTAEDYQRLMTKYPEMSKQIDQSLQAFNAQQKQAKINQMMSMYAPLKSGNTEAAKARLDEMIAAYRNSGQELEAKNMETVKENIDLDPKGAETAAEMFLFQALGAEGFKKFAEARGTLGEESRSAQLQPEQLKLKKAEVIKAGIDAGLTQKEALKTEAATRKLDAETQKIVLEMEALKKGGNLSPDKKVDLEQKLADKYFSRTKDFSSIQSSFDNLVISAKEKNGPGDLALITGFMKILDPGSVVRETEFASARDTAGLYQSLKNMVGKWKEGDLLSDPDRAKFVNLSKKYMDAAEKQEKQVREQIKYTVDSYGLDEKIVLPERMAQPEAMAQPAGQPEQTATNPKTGQKIAFRNGQWVDVNTGQPI